MEIRDDRLWAAFAIEIDEHAKFISLSDAAFRAYFEGTFYSRRMLTDGFLDERVVQKRWSIEAANELASNDPEKPSWIQVEGGWMIHDFEKHHPLKVDIEASRDALREKRQAAGRAGGKASGEARRSKSKQAASNLEAKGKQNEAKSQSQSQSQIQDLPIHSESISPVVDVREKKTDSDQIRLSDDPLTHDAMSRRAEKLGHSALEVYELQNIVLQKLNRDISFAEVLDLVDEIVKKSPRVVRNAVAYVLTTVESTPFEVQKMIDQGIPFQELRLVGP